VIESEQPTTSLGVMGSNAATTQTYGRPAVVSALIALTSVLWNDETSKVDMADDIFRYDEDELEQNLNGVDVASFDWNNLLLELDSLIV